MQTTEKYLETLNLDEDQLEDVQEEIDEALKAWQTIVGEDSYVNLSSTEDSFLSNLVTKLGTTYCEEDHGFELKNIAGSENILKRDSFVDWYVRWVFKIDDIEGDLDEEPEEDFSKPSGQNKGWGNISWSVAPTSQATEGKSWKCINCKIINLWESHRCLACDSVAPHAQDSSQPVDANSSSVTSTVFQFQKSTEDTSLSTTIPGITFGTSNFSTTTASSSSTATPNFSFGTGGSISFGNTVVPVNKENSI